MEVGEILGDRYAILGLLGSGPRGAVYESENLLMGNRVAVKALTPAAHTLLEPARACSRLDHPGIARVLDVSPTLDPAYVVCEKVAGVAFTAAALTPGHSGQLEDWKIALDLTLQVLGALGYAHDQGLIHGALHPRNVLIRYPRPGVPWATITDFGGNRTDAHLDTSDRRLYLAPEVLAGEIPSAQSDLFAVATLLRSSLSNSARFPAELMRALGATLNADPRHRPASADLLAATLSPLLRETGAGLHAAPWSRAPNILYSGSSTASAEAPAGSNRRQRVGAGRRDSRVTDSLLRNPHFLRANDDNGKPQPTRLWRFIALGLGVGLLATFALTWLASR